MRTFIRRVFNLPAWADWVIVIILSLLLVLMALCFLLVLSVGLARANVSAYLSPEFWVIMIAYLWPVVVVPFLFGLLVGAVILFLVHRVRGCPVYWKKKWQRLN